MRIEHSRFKNIYENYKRDFRPTKQFKKAAQAALTLIKENMLCNSVRKLNDKFSTLNRADIENTEIFFDVDFNDYYISNICRQYNIPIVTADKDFRNPNIKCDVILIT